MINKSPRMRDAPSDRATQRGLLRPRPGFVQAGRGSDRAARWRLFALSFLMLFVELALIRWTGSNVLYLSYFSNFVLLGSFLGIGLGFLRADAKRNLFRWSPVA